MLESTTARAQLQRRLDELLAQHPVPGYTAGIWWDGKRIELAAGTANLNTGAPMTPDTAFLLGSISKVLVATMLMRFVERGQLALDDRVATHLPELCVADQHTRENLTVLNLLNHTSGIDAADDALEFGRGNDATRQYVAALAGAGQLYPLGEHISYCNPAFIIAGRMLEVLSGETFDTLLKREIFAPIGMQRSCTSGDEAILHRTAVGHIVDPESGELRVTPRFMLPYSMAGAGSTVITTVSDILRFAQTHLLGGITPDGTRLLSPESVAAMATPTMTEEQMFGLSIGLGWAMPENHHTRILAHGGGSPGGASTLIVIPAERFAFAAFGNSTAAGAIHTKMTELVLGEVVGLPPGEHIVPTPEALDPERYAGVFARQYHRIEVTPAEDGKLGVTITVDYGSDEVQRKLFREYTGREQTPPLQVQPVTPALFIPAGQAVDSIARPGAYGAGVLFLDPDRDGRFQYLSMGLRMARRIA